MRDQETGWSKYIAEMAAIVLDVFFITDLKATISKAEDTHYGIITESNIEKSALLKSAFPFTCVTQVRHRFVFYEKIARYRPLVP